MFLYDVLVFRKPTQSKEAPGLKLDQRRPFKDKNYFNVALEVSSLFGGVISLCASERLLTTMNQHMLFEITRLLLQRRKCTLPFRYQLKFDSGREGFYTIV